MLAPWCAVYENALSDLGRPGRSSAPLFNGAVIASGTLGIGFIAGLWRRSAPLLKRLGIALFGVAAVFVALVGVFPTPHPYHFPVAAGFYLTLTFALFVHGTGEALDGSVGPGLAILCLGIVHITSWVVWWTVMDGQGIAGPEAVGAGVFSLWVCGMVWRSSRNPACSAVKT